MTRTFRARIPDLYADPFAERSSRTMRLQLQLLGARFTFESNSRQLLGLVQDAYGKLPAHRFTAGAPALSVRLLLRPAGPERSGGHAEPVALDMFSGHGWLGAASRSSDFVVLSARQRTALIVVSPHTLAFPYHTRYELIEFAVFTLAARCQRLASLHAACVGLAGRGVLLMGSSGAGKSTITMMSALQGFDFLAEDSVFVTPATLRATGIANYLHVRSDSLRWIDHEAREAIRRSPVIRRRSGVRKYEVDLRRAGYRLARAPLRIASVVFLSARNAGAGSPLKALSRRTALSSLTAAQAYAANQPGWREFSGNLLKLPIYELRRGRHPGESVEALRALLTVS